jgi:hypothetical protein
VWVYDAPYCSHNLEHYLLHEVPRLLLIQKDAFADITTPDLGAVMKAVVTGCVELQDILLAGIQTRCLV